MTNICNVFFHHRLIRRKIDSHLVSSKWNVDFKDGCKQLRLKGFSLYSVLLVRPSISHSASNFDLKCLPLTIGLAPNLSGIDGSPLEWKVVPPLDPRDHPPLLVQLWWLVLFWTGQ